jgi:hypothetical protein
MIKYTRNNYQFLILCLLAIVSISIHLYEPKDKRYIIGTKDFVVAGSGNKIYVVRYMEGSFLKEIDTYSIEEAEGLINYLRRSK